MNTIKLPSQFQVGDPVGLGLLAELVQTGTAEVTKVSFLAGKVRYDLQILSGDVFFRLPNVDSAFVDQLIDDDRTCRERIVDELINGADSGIDAFKYLKRNRSKQVD